MTKSKPKTVEEYIQVCPDYMQSHLYEMRKYIQTIIPDAVEGIKWGQPAYSDKTILVAFAGHKDHANLYPTPSTIKALSDELSHYKIGKGSIQFPYDKPLPSSLIKKIIAYRVKEYKEQGIKWM